MTKRVLLDEGVPRHLAKPLSDAGFPTTTDPNSWKQLTNGELLARAETERFDVLITNDRNLRTQQNLRGRRLAIIALPTNLRRHVMERVAGIIDTVERIEAGQYVVIESSGQRTVLNHRDSESTEDEMPPIAPFDLK